MGISRREGQKGITFAWPWSFLFVPLLFVAAGISIPFTLVGSHLQRRRERAFLRQMKTLGRVMEWPDLLRAIKENQGTFITERYSFKGPVRCWWTQENLYDASPYPTVDWLTMSRDESFHPFAEWCRERYTSPTTGRGFLVAADTVPLKQRKALRSPFESAESETMTWIDVVPPETFRRKQSGRQRT